MKTISYSITILFFSILFLSCNPNSNSVSNTDSSTKNDVKQTTNTDNTLKAKSDLDKIFLLKNLLDREPTDSLIGDEDLGQEVDIDSAERCIRLFKPEMARFGIEVRERQIRAILIRSRKITESEEFGGKNLLGWLLKTVQNLDSTEQGKNISIRLKLGIYTDSFLNTYIHNNPVLISKKKNRITIFLVPFDRRTNKMITTKASAYELGGLQP